MVFWVFGYSSLVWSPGFEFDAKMVGYIKGYRRVFDVACIDHRGTPERPARVCSLEADEEAVCWGVAYCVKGGEEKQRAALEYLEKRECEYDLKLHVDFYKEGQDAPAISGVILFTATAELEYKYYLGPAPFDEMARQIATAVGPCGNNREYLFSLEKALSNIGHEDDYVIELANKVRKVLSRSREQRMMTSPKHKAPFNQAAAIYHSTSSTAAAAAAGGANSHCFPLITTFTPDAAPSLAVESLLS